MSDHLFYATLASIVIATYGYVIFFIKDKSKYKMQVAKDLKVVMAYYSNHYASKENHNFTTHVGLAYKTPKTEAGYAFRRLLTQKLSDLEMHFTQTEALRACDECYVELMHEFGLTPDMLINAK